MNKFQTLFLCFMLLRSASPLTENNAPTSSSPSRRTYLSKALLSLPLIGSLTAAQSANAAAPITRGESENVGAQAARLFRPKPPKILRPPIDKDFAVLLMRSSYNALDQLDCVAMDQFQRDFFIIRQAEYEPYTKLLGPGFVQQGDLTNPFYFDFISFAQYVAINREISRDPPYVFEEQQPVEVGEGELQKFEAKVVKRDPSLSNDMLGPEHSRLVGAAILDRFDEALTNTPLALPVRNRPDVQTLLASFQQMVKLFVINGFAVDGSADLVSQPTSLSSASGAEFCLTLGSPATIWGSQSLRFQRAGLLNDYL